METQMTGRAPAASRADAASIVAWLGAAAFAAAAAWYTLAVRGGDGGPGAPARAVHAAAADRKSVV